MPLDIPAKPKYEDKVIFEKGVTEDIMTVTLMADDEYYLDTKRMGENLHHSENSLYGLWSDVRNEIEYKRDENGHERIKGPAYTFNEEGSGDCKSLSVITGTTLRNAKLPYVYRFVSWPDDPNKIRHVYPVAYLNGREYILDSVNKVFDAEMPYAYKKDLKPEGLDSINGLPTSSKSFGLFEISIAILFGIKLINVNKNFSNRIIGNNWI